MTTEVALSQDLVALIDDDMDLVNAYKWCAVKNGGIYYALTNVRTGKRRTPGDGSPRSIRMHRLILAVGPNELVDHQNSNGLDNQRSNLRKATPAENSRNGRKRNGTSNYKGVCWMKHNNKWMAQIYVDYHHLYLGLFESELDAAKAYDKAALEHHDEFARINFPQEEAWQQID